MLVEGDRDSQQSFTRSIAIWTFWPTFAVVLGLIFFGKEILATFGPDFVVGYPALIVLTLGYLTQATTGPISSYLAVSGNQDHIVAINFSAAIFNILLNLLLIPTWGVLGAAIGSVGSILLSQIWTYLLVRRNLKINPVFFARVGQRG